MTRSIPGARESCATNRRPRSPATPVTSTTWPMCRPSAVRSASMPTGLLAQTATLHARLLQQLAMLLLRHALAAFLDDRTHAVPNRCLIALEVLSLTAGQGVAESAPA